jgi:HSP20 family molecular chaperone IbpA
VKVKEQNQALFSFRQWKNVSIDLHENQLTVSGEVEPLTSEKEEYLLQEFETGIFHRQFTLSDRIDQSSITATVKDGVLRLVLPKAEKVKPRSLSCQYPKYSLRLCR